MRFEIITALTMVAAVSSTNIPAMFARSKSCIPGPNYAGDMCEEPNNNAKSCGPGNKGNIVRLNPLSGC